MCENADAAADFFATNPSLQLEGPVETGLNVWIYSTGYNMLYLAPSLLFVGICLLVIAPILAKAVPVRKQHAQESKTSEEAA